jgi:VIT1/CCC1 family predicted Fe2+/Mn2+ transporter
MNRAPTGRRRPLPDIPTAPSQRAVRRHIIQERRRVSALGEVREIIFGAQDGLLSTLGVVTAVSTASGDQGAVMVAGVASAFAGMVSMLAGEYISSKSQRDVYLAEIEREREEADQRPEESDLEIRLLFEEEGLSPEDAAVVAEKLASSKQSRLKTMVEKELRLVLDEEAGPVRGAALMALSFLLGSAAPILPYVFLPLGQALIVSIGATLVVLFGIGVGKAVVAESNKLRGGLEILFVGALAGVAGYFLGTLLPLLLGRGTPPG